MFEKTFKNVDDILHKDAGCSSELDYVEQSSWVLFLKYIDDLESARKVGAELGNKKYTPIISGKYRWTEWAVPKTKDGKIDHVVQAMDKYKLNIAQKTTLNALIKQSKK